MRSTILGLALSFSAVMGCSSSSAGPAVCSTGSVAGDHESSVMKPGGDCIGCHAQGEGPRFTIAGTVMNAYNDDTDCNGVSGVTVRLTDTSGKSLDLVTNSAGNFYRQGATGIGTPFTVKLINGTRERSMATPQTDGNCVSCHTAQGANGAPGRILAP